MVVGVICQQRQLPIALLMGLTPGKNLSQEAQTVLAPLAGLSNFTSFTPGIGSISPEYKDADIGIFTTVNYIVDLQENIINHLAFRAEAHKSLSDGVYENSLIQRLLAKRPRGIKLLPFFLHWAHPVQY